MRTLIYKWLKRPRLVKKYGEEKVAIAELRRELSFWDPEANNLTDDQVREGVNKIAKAFSSSGVSLAQASENIRRAGL